MILMGLHQMIKVNECALILIAMLLIFNNTLNPALLSYF